ncbi:hypothetical protein FRC11_012753, partial [Ceratobasidium sp. 423]
MSEDDVSSDYEGESTSLNSYFPRNACTVCMGRRPSGKFRAFRECGHLMCKYCVKQMRGPRQAREISCPLCRQDRDCSNLREVAFDIVPYDRPEVMEDKKTHLLQLEEENQQLKKEKKQLLDKIEENTFAHSALKNELLDLGEHGWR